MVSNRLQKWCVSVFLLACCFTVDALEVTATVDRNPVMIDEAFTLTVTATGNVDRDAFQSDVLLADFIVGNTSVSSQTQMVNFNTTRSTTWRTTLFPKEEGIFVIPAIEIEGAKTQPLSVRVIPVPTVTTQEQRDFFVTAELVDTRAFVQQHVTYKVKLHMAANIERGSLQAPELDSARIEQVGDDKQYSEIVSGKRFQIVERTFVIIPEQSGQFTIQAPIFSGEVLATNTRQSFGFFNRTRSITRRGPQLDLTVLPIPNGTASAWLPSEFVELSESWPEDKRFVVGEPITRKLILTVAGQTEEQLPEIEQLYPPSIKTYPDQAETASTERDGVLIAQRTESTAIIPTEPGQIVLPGVEVDWFNTRTQQTETASIPAKTIQVAPAASQTATNDIANIAPSPLAQEELSNTLDLATSGNRPVPVMWMALSSIFALLWVVTSIAWWRARSKPSAPVERTRQVSDDSSVSRKALIKSLEENNLPLTQSLLLKWLRNQLDRNFVSLHEALAHPQAVKIKHEYQAMTASRFSSNQSKWSPRALIDAILEYEKTSQKSRSKNTDALPDLYPIEQ